MFLLLWVIASLLNSTQVIVCFFFSYFDKSSAFWRVLTLEHLIEIEKKEGRD